MHHALIVAMHHLRTALSALLICSVLSPRYSVLPALRCALYCLLVRDNLRKSAVNYLLSSLCPLRLCGEWPSPNLR